MYKCVKFAQACHSGRRSEAKASPESITTCSELWIPGSRPAAEPRNDGAKVCLDRPRRPEAKPR
jgi:hypothetical protein